MKLLTLPALWLPALADTDCAEAYRRGCFKHFPFKGCCNGGQCQSAHFGTKCHWEVDVGPCCPELTGEFLVDPEPECENACLALGKNSFTIQDFCPGSGLEKLVRPCRAAHESWSKAFQNYKKNQKTSQGVCSSNAVATCFFNYSGITTSLKGGQFNFPAKEEGCFEVCEKLGSSLRSEGDESSKEAYCGILNSAQQTCSSAFECFKNPSSDGCQGMKEAQSVCGSTIAGLLRSNATVENSLTAAHSLQGAAMRSQFLSGMDLHEDDKYCDQAFQEGCWKTKPFSSCCSDCSGGCNEFEWKCTWDYQFKWEDPTEKLEKDVSFQHSNCASAGENQSHGTEETCDKTCSCRKACTLLSDPTNNPCWYCDTPEQWKNVKLDCPEAFTYDRPGWCKICNAKEVLLATEEPLRRDPVLAAAGATMMLVALVAIVATLKSRWHVSEDGHQGLLHS